MERGNKIKIDVSAKFFIHAKKISPHVFSYQNDNAQYSINSLNIFYRYLASFNKRQHISTSNSQVFCNTTDGETDVLPLHANHQSAMNNHLSLSVAAINLSNATQWLPSVNSEDDYMAWKGNERPILSGSKSLNASPLQEGIDPIVSGQGISSYQWLMMGYFASTGLVGFSVVASSNFKEKQPDEAPVIQGNVVAGPLVKNHGIEVGFFSLGDDLSVYYAKPDDNGYFYLNESMMPGAYLVRAMDTSEEPDYLNQASGFETDMVSDLKAIVFVDEASRGGIVYLNPLTTLIYKIFTKNNELYQLTSERFLAVNHGLSQAFGFEKNVDNLSTMNVKNVVDYNGHINHDANAIGKILASLSGVESKLRNLDVFDQWVNSVDVDNLILTDELRRYLIEGAEIIDARLNTAIKKDILNMLSSNIYSPIVTVNDEPDLLEDLSNDKTISLSGFVSTLKNDNQLIIDVTDGMHTVQPMINRVGNEWLIPHPDFSDLQEGPVYIKAKIMTKNGDIVAMNETSFNYSLSSPDIVKLTVPSKHIIDTESSGLIISGDTLHIDDYDVIQIMLVDHRGNRISERAIVENNIFRSTQLDLSPLEAGRIDVVASISLPHEDVVTAFAEFQWVTTPPTITFDRQIEQSGTINTKQIEAVSVKGVIQHAVDVDKIEIAFDDGTQKIFSHATILDHNWHIHPVSLHELADGLITVTASMHDKSGYVSTVDHIYVKDTMAPLLTMREIENQGYINQSIPTEWVLEGGVSELGEGGSVVVIVTSDQGTALYNAEINNGFWQLTLNPFDQFSEGSFVVAVEAIDAAGNKSIPISQKIILDITEPKIDFLETLSLPETNHLSSWQIEGYAEGVEDGQKISLMLSDGDQSLSLAPIVTNERWVSLPIDITQFSGDSLDIKIHGNDSAGNISEEQTITFALKPLVPSITIDDDSIDRHINRLEAENLTLSGRIKGLDNSHFFELIVSDSMNQRVISPQVISDYWVVERLKLEDFSDGLIDVTVRSRNHNNEIVCEATTSYHLDRLEPLIELGSTIYPGKKMGITAAKSLTLPIHIKHAEVGQNITVDMTDTKNNSLHYSQVLSESTWHYLTLDVSSLVMGEIVIGISMSDIAGNETTLILPLFKDDEYSVLAINPVIAVDNWVNAFESQRVKVHGATNDLEEAQKIVLVARDDTLEKRYEATKNGSEWFARDLDVTAFSDGYIDFWAETADEAGNAVKTDTESIWLDRSVIRLPLKEGEEGNLLNPIHINGKTFYFFDRNLDGVIEKNDKINLSELNALVKGDLNTVTQTIDSIDYKFALPDVTDFSDLGTDIFGQSMVRSETDRLWAFSSETSSTFYSVGMQTLSLLADDYTDSHYLLLEVIVI